MAPYAESAEEWPVHVGPIRVPVPIDPEVRISSLLSSLTHLPPNMDFSSRSVPRVLEVGGNGLFQRIQLLRQKSYADERREQEQLLDSHRSNDYSLRATYPISSRELPSVNVIELYRTLGKRPRDSEEEQYYLENENEAIILKQKKQDDEEVSSSSDEESRNKNEEAEEYIPLSIIHPFSSSSSSGSESESEDFDEDDDFDEDSDEDEIQPSQNPLLRELLKMKVKRQRLY